MTIFNNTWIVLSPYETLRALLGRKICINTEIDVDADVQVLDTRQTITVEPLAKADEPGLYTLLSTAPPVSSDLSPGADHQRIVS